MDKAGVIFALLTVFAVMTGSWFFAGLHVSLTTDVVEYELLYETGNNIEVREYGEMTVISTSSADPDDAFLTLTSYIYGKNAENLKFDMIYPVLTSEDENVITMSFILPSGYDIGNAPSPNDPQISIHTIPARKVAVTGFSGYAKERIVEKHRLILNSQLEANTITTKGDFFLMRYYPSWIAPTLMRNEIAIEVK